MGSRDEVKFKGNEAPLEFLQEQVGGFIEIVPDATRTIFVNEDRLMLNLPPNKHAHRELGNARGSVDGYLGGVVVIVEPMQ